MLKLGKTGRNRSEIEVGSSTLSALTQHREDIAAGARASTKPIYRKRHGLTAAYKRANAEVSIRNRPRFSSLECSPVIRFTQPQLPLLARKDDGY